MTIDDPGQPQFLRLLCACAVALVVVLHTGATAATRRRSSRKISVPVGYKFSPTDGDLGNQYLKRKLMNLTEQHCLIPELNHYEAEPWDLITKYNELSDGESKDDECFFFSTNRSSSKRVHRRTPKGRWHETSEKKTIQGTDGVAYVMKYFTFYNGHQRQNRDITAWRMREFTHPSNKELALCKIFKDVDGQKKKKDGLSSVIPEPSTSLSISPGSQTPEAYSDVAAEARTPTSANLTCNNLVSPQWPPTPLDETLLSYPNPMDCGVIAHYQQHPNPMQERYPPSQNAFIAPYQQHPNPMEERYPPSQNAFIAPHQQHPNPMEERYQPSQNAFGYQFLDFDNPQPYDQFLDPNLMKDGVISTHHQQPMHTEEGSPLAQADGYLDFTDSCQASEQPPMKKSRRERNFSSTNNSPFSSRCHQDFLASPSNGLSLDEIFTPNGTNIEVHNDESTFRLSPSNYSTSDTSEPTGSQMHQAQQPIQQQALSEVLPLPQSPTQPWNSGLPCSNTAAPQQMDMPIISEEWKFPDIDYDHQYSWEVTESYSPRFI